MRDDDGERDRGGFGDGGDVAGVERFRADVVEEEHADEDFHARHAESGTGAGPPRPPAAEQRYA